MSKNNVVLTRNRNEKYPEQENRREREQRYYRARSTIIRFASLVVKFLKIHPTIFLEEATVAEGQVISHNYLLDL